MFHQLTGKSILMDNEMKEIYLNEAMSKLEKWDTDSNPEVGARNMNACGDAQMKVGRYPNGDKTVDGDVMNSLRRKSYHDLLETTEVDEDVEVLYEHPMKSNFKVCQRGSGHNHAVWDVIVNNENTTDDETNSVVISDCLDSDDSQILSAHKGHSCLRRTESKETQDGKSYKLQGKYSEACIRKRRAGKVNLLDGSSSTMLSDASKSCLRNHGSNSRETLFFPGPTLKERMTGQWNSLCCIRCTETTICAHCNLTLYNDNRQENLLTLAECYQKIQTAFACTPNMQRKQSLYSLHTDTSNPKWSVLYQTPSKDFGKRKTPSSSTTFVKSSTDAINDNWLPNYWPSLANRMDQMSRAEVVPRTQLMVRFIPNEIPYDSKRLVEMDYHVYGEESFDALHVIQGDIKDLKPVSNRDNQESPNATFLCYLEYFMNNLQGDVWWDGFLMRCTNTPSERLDLMDLDFTRAQLTFSGTEVRAYNVSCRPRCVVIQVETHDGSFKEFRIEATRSDCDLQGISVGKDYGRIIVQLPQYKTTS